MPDADRAVLRSRHDDGEFRVAADGGHIVSVALHRLYTLLGLVIPHLMSCTRVLVFGMQRQTRHYYRMGYGARERAVLVVREHAPSQSGHRRPRLDKAGRRRRNTRHNSLPSRAPQA
eukprot:scaffold275491_cov28-Tisochrysis_lutea.AAC.8